MPLQQLTAPLAEPLSLAEAKRHCRITASDEDALFQGLVAAARAACETRTQNQLLASRWKLVMDSFPGQGITSYVPYGRVYGLPPNAIVIPKAPVLQVVSITYLDMAGVTQTLVAGQNNDYVVDLSSAPARITPPFGTVWPPNVMPQIGSVVVTFDAGYAAPLTADPAADSIYVPGWKTLAVNDMLRLINRDEVSPADGGLPGGLSAFTDYYARSVVSADRYTLAASSGGALIDITSAGTGRSFIGDIPGALRAWMLLAIGSLYENRESISVDPRISQVELPLDFLDGLLDPYRLVLY